MICPYALTVRRRTLLMLGLGAEEIAEQCRDCPPTDLDEEIERYYVLCEAQGRGAKSIYESVARRAGKDLEPAWEPLAPADRPCAARPGTAERMREYRRRLELGREMWHEQDDNGDE